jgi:hypothetical protein
LYFPKGIIYIFLKSQKDNNVHLELKNKILIQSGQKPCIEQLLREAMQHNSIVVPKKTGILLQLQLNPKYTRQQQHTEKRVPAITRPASTQNELTY